MATANSKNQRIYVQKESSWGVIPNSSGAATVGNTDACRHTEAEMNGAQEMIERPDKTGNLSRTIGVGGRRNSNWRVAMSLAGSGAAGTKPDMDPFLEALFGQAGNVVASTSVTYSLADAHPSLSIWDFRTPAAMTQQVAFGSIVTQVRMDFGDPAPIIDFSGESKWVLDSPQYDVLTDGDPAKGGLTDAGQATFPTEPTSPATNGDMAIGFTGAITLNGISYTTLRRGSIAIATARELPKDVFNNYYPTSPAADIRDVTGEFSLDDTDSSDLDTLKQKARDKEGVTLIFQIGLNAGNIWKWTLKNCLMDFQYDDSQRKYGLAFTYTAHASSITALDEVELALT
jgi:hypothetical protein